MANDQTISYQSSSGTKSANPRTVSIKDTDEGWSWDLSSKTLELNGIDIKTTDNTGLVVPTGATIVVKSNANQIWAEFNGLGSSNAIYVERPNGGQDDVYLTINGDGILKVIGGNTRYQPSAVSGEAGDPGASNVIYLEGHLTIDGVELILIGGESADDFSECIVAYNGYTDRGSVTIGKNKPVNMDISSGQCGSNGTTRSLFTKDFKLYSGKVKAFAGNTTLERSAHREDEKGPESVALDAQSIKQYGGSLELSCGTAEMKYIGVEEPDGIAVSAAMRGDTIELLGGTTKAESGLAVNRYTITRTDKCLFPQCYGILANQTFTLDGGSVAAYGAKNAVIDVSNQEFLTDDEGSWGVYAEDAIILRSGSLTAKGHFRAAHAYGGIYGSGLNIMASTEYDGVLKTGYLSNRFKEWFLTVPTDEDIWEYGARFVKVSAAPSATVNAAPATGDDSQPILWAGLMVLTGFMAFSMSRLGRKRRRQC